MLDALWHGIWADNSLSGQFIVATILVLLVWAYRAGSGHCKRYRREEASLSTVIEKLRSHVESAPEDGQEESRDRRHVSPADLALLRKDLAPDSLIVERLEAIAKLRTRQVRVNPSALQQLSLARDEARPGMAIPAAVAGLATMLGLLGTFLGLAVMVQKVQFVLPQSSGSLTVGSWTQSVENLSGVLGGIKTAFSRSLVGIVCSILASLVNFRLRTAQALFFERLERFTTEELLPAAVPAVEDESLLDRVSLQLESSFARLDEIYRLNQDALKDMTGAQRAFVDIVEEIRKITRSETSRNLDGVLDQLSRTNQSVLSVADQLPKIVTAVELGQRRLLDRLSSILASAAPAAVPPRQFGRLTTRTRVWAFVLAALALTLLLLKI